MCCYFPAATSERRTYKIVSIAYYVLYINIILFIRYKPAGHMRRRIVYTYIVLNVNSEYIQYL